MDTLFLGISNSIKCWEKCILVALSSPLTLNDISEHQHSASVIPGWIHPIYFYKPTIELVIHKLFIKSGENWKFQVQFM